MPRNNNIQFRKGNYNEWDSSSSTVLASGEPGFVTDYRLLKVGDGITQWSDLPAINDALTTVVRNDSGSTINKMSVVYISGAQGDLPRIALSIASGESTSSRTYGIVVNDIDNGSVGQVIVEGTLRNLNTNAQFHGVSPGTTLWLSPSTSGGLTATKPFAPNHMVSVGTLIRVHNTQGIINVKIQNGFELEELHNVAVTGVSNGQFLQYNSGSGLWVPSSSGNFNSLKVNNSDVLVDNGFLVKTTGDQSISGSKSFEDSLFAKKDFWVNATDERSNPSIIFYDASTQGGGVAGITCANDGSYIDIELDGGFGSNETASFSALDNGKIGFRANYIESDDAKFDSINNLHLSNKNIISSSGGILVDSGNLIVNKGIIEVNNSFNNAFNMVINSSGINITQSPSIIVKYVDEQSDSPTFYNTTYDLSIPEAARVFRRRFGAVPTTGDNILFTQFTDPIFNGIYTVSGTLSAASFVRKEPYISGATISANTLIGVTQKGSIYALNSSTNKIIGTDALNFQIYIGDNVVQIQPNKDIEFASAIIAQEKYFRIKHPDPDSDYQYLQYGSLESPYHGVRLTGKSMLKRGESIIYLPYYIKHLIHPDDVSIQITNKGHHKILYVDSVDINNNKFVVKGYRSKTGGPYEFYWSFTGIRKDTDRLIPEI